MKNHREEVNPKPSNFEKGKVKPSHFIEARNYWSNHFNRDNNITLCPKK